MPIMRSGVRSWAQRPHRGNSATREAQARVHGASERFARAEVRAKRRFLEYSVRSEPVTYEAILADILRRDERDASRGDAPMRPAPDADLLDTSDLDIEAAFDAAVGLIKRKIGR